MTFCVSAVFEKRLGRRLNPAAATGPQKGIRLPNWAVLVVSLWSIAANSRCGHISY